MIIGNIKDNWKRTPCASASQWRSTFGYCFQWWRNIYKSVPCRLAWRSVFAYEWHDDEANHRWRSNKIRGEISRPAYFTRSPPQWQRGRRTWQWRGRLNSLRLGRGRRMEGQKGQPSSLFNQAIYTNSKQLNSTACHQVFHQHSSYRKLQISYCHRKGNQQVHEL